MNDGFLSKTEVSVNMVRHMIDSWIPKESKESSTSIRSDEGKVARSTQPMLYNTFPGEAKSRKKKLEAKIVAKKAEAQVARVTAAQLKEDGEDSRTQAVSHSVHAASSSGGEPGSVISRTESAGMAKDRGVAAKRKLAGSSALAQYLSKKKKK
ncbi:hypothetical protein BC830DRAFT_1144947 [Chytriomyces sp. MP71]|nr:hypothetical protein BC830DRAFT_1144947 [Chytriomyces sp. MP71]